MSGSFRVSIPSNVRKTIQNIKEIAGNHSDEEVYAMLKECSMDPNETTQRLLLQGGNECIAFSDTFHEVKRKRDKRKENIRDPADSRWKQGVQGRGGRSGRGNYSSRCSSNDIVGGRNVTSRKENGVNQGTDGGNKSSLSANPDAEKKSSISVSSSIPGLANGPSNVDHPISSHACSSQVSGVSQIASKEESSAAENNKLGKTSLISDDVKSGSASGHSVPGSSQSVPSKVASVSGVYASSSDPVLVPSLETCSPGDAGTIKCVIGSQRTVVEMTTKAASCDISGPELLSLRQKGSPDISHSPIHGKVRSRSQGPEVYQLSDTSHAASSSLSGPTGSRPSSTYSSRSQQLTGSQKAVVANKEWKPKLTHTNSAQASGTPGTSDVSTVVEAVSESPPVLSENMALKLEKKLDELQLSDRRHVIIPNHLQVPESERHGLSFGSFESSFNLSISFANGPAIDQSTAPPPESSQEIKGNVEDSSSSSRDASPTFQEVDYPDHPQSPIQMPENFSCREADIPSSVPAAPEYDQSKEAASLAPEGPQYSVVHTAPSYSAFGLVPQMLGSQLASFESSESQTRDTTRLPSFVVQQPFDPSSSYYTQFYRPTADAEGRFSPFLAPGATKYNGNIALLPAQAGQAPQESGNSVVLSTAGSTSLGTQAAGVMPSSVAVPQQPVPLFRQPAGVHISHYPPNYIPYSQYFSPFYVPPPALHHFLSNAAFPQQPPTGSVYPPGAAAATPVKYSISQYKPGTNTGNSALVGMPTGYGTYNSSPAGYTPNPAVSSGNSTGNEDLTAPQFKENNVYMPGQQSEGSAVWIPAAAGRDISSLQASSFYSFPPQGPHMTFAPTQAGHGAFSGLYHPTPTVAAAAVHPLLQQSQTVAGAVEMFEDVEYKVRGAWRNPMKAAITSVASQLRVEQGRCKHILKGITGSVGPGEILALMGPSGSGKTTLLKVLGGRLDGDIKGNITYNDTPYSPFIKRRIGFVTQDDVLFPQLTVEETLVFAAFLRLPTNMTSQHKYARADAIIKELSLERCRHTKVGGVFVKGISGGERKRTSIGYEILVDPSLLLLDEPTSGLDSTSASKLLMVLQNLAKTGRTIITTIHQPSSRMFHMFDKLLLISQGYPIYHGEARESMRYFASLGFVPEIAMNPAEFLLDLVTGHANDISIPEALRGSPNPQGFEIQVIKFLQQKYKTEVEPKEREENHRATKAPRHLQIAIQVKKDWTMSWIEQLLILSKRTFRERCGDYLDKLRSA
ncbi:putative GBF-interacting protein 1-like [Cocos nucifera]|uniref:Putative GBF-interacting protein 1-like n=2 Tax=Magnoliopsida TaxID=3398 RepID=A0A8K0HUI4_COCNU|nr:putative GBF-interacting protein 1-like [Cocos nucifera]